MPVNTPSPKSPGPAGSSKPMNVWMIVSAVLAIALIITFVTAGKGSGGDSSFTPISSDEAGTTLISFVNKVYGAQIGSSTLKTVTEKSGMYEIVVSVDNAGQQVDQTVFVSKDGKFFIPQALEIADVISQFDAFQAQGGAIDPGAVQPVVDDVAPVDDGAMMEDN